jgi:hypothetical protein
MNYELRRCFQCAKGYLTGEVGTWEIWYEMEDGSWDLYADNVWSFCDIESRYDQFKLAQQALENLEETNLGVTQP